MSRTPVRFYRISDAASALNAGQMCIEPLADSDLGFKAVGYKDDDGTARILLAKDENARVADMIADQIYTDTGFRDQYLSADITLSESGVTGLIDYTATSIIGALNEVKSEIGAISELSGSGTANYIPQWQDSSTLTDSPMQVNGTNVGIGVSPDVKFQVYEASSTVIVRLECGTTAINNNDEYGIIQFEGNDASASANGVRASVTAAASDANGDAGAAALIMKVTDPSDTTLYEIFRAQSIGASNREAYFTDCKVGIGTNSPSVLAHFIATSEQLRLGYDASNYLSFVIDALGDATITPQGTTVTISGLMAATTISGVLVDGVTCTTQSPGDNTTKVASTAFVTAAITALPDTFLALTDTVSSFTSGRVLYESGSAVVDSANFTFSGTDLYVSGSVGVGNSSPATALDVIGEITSRQSSANNNGAKILTVDGSNNAVFIGKNSTGTTNISLNAGDVSYINGGNVGIGISIPVAKLDLQGSLNQYIAKFYQQDSSTGSGFYVKTDNISASYRALAVDLSTTRAFEILGDGKVGINITPTTYQFEVDGGIASITGGQTTYLSGNQLTCTTGDLYIDAATTYSIFFRDGSTTNVTINGSGNVGIAKSTLESWNANYCALELGGNNNLMSLRAEQAGSGFYINQNAYFDGNFKRISTDEVSTIAMFSGNIVFYTDASDTADVAYTQSERMRIDSVGTLGLGVSSLKTWNNSYVAAQIGPTGSLISYATAIPNGYLKLMQNSHFTTSATYQRIADGYVEHIGLDNGAIFFYCNDTGTAGVNYTPNEIMRLTKDNRVGINIAPSYDLEVAGTDIQLTGTTFARLNLIAQNSNVSQIYLGDTDDADVCYISYDHMDDAFSLYVNTSDTMSVDSSNNISLRGGENTLAIGGEAPYAFALPTEDLQLIDFVTGASGYSTESAYLIIRRPGSTGSYRVKLWTP